ncbi:MAG: hypothetical protein CL583_01830 [Alteromonadaceae bacterium]|nr:hypothetical protein [Alteromonadaceae bacterium]
MRKCRHCKAELPSIKNSDPVQAKGFCEFEHAVQYGRQKAKESREKRERKEQRERKQSIKRRSEWLSEAQAEFNKFIRARDADQPCICCGVWADESWKPGGTWDAGHYLSRGSHPELAFDEANCHKQLKSCNAGAGKYTKKNFTVSQQYRERLIQKIGEAEVLRLEGPHEPKKYTIDELKELKTYYRRLTRELKRKAA